MIPLLRTLVGLTFGWFITRFIGVLARLHLHSSPGSSLVSRRGFLRNATLGSVTIVLSMLTAGTVRLLWPNKVTGFGSVMTVPASDIPEVGADPFRFTPGRFFIVHNEDGLLALWWKCPHLGCTVPWTASEEQFHCPCHGSIYDRNGVRTAGPAPRPMDLMKITIEAGDLKVDTGTISTRSDYSPDQAVPYTA